MSEIRETDIERRLAGLSDRLGGDAGFSARTMERISDMPLPEPVRWGGRMAARLCVAAVVTVAIGLVVAMWPNGGVQEGDAGGGVASGGSGNSAYAQVVENVEKATSMKYRYRIIALDSGEPVITEGLSYTVNKGPGVNMTRTANANGKVSISVYNNEGTIRFSLDPETKIARRDTELGWPEGPRMMNIVAESSQMDAGIDPLQPQRIAQLDGRMTKIYEFVYESEDRRQGTYDTVWVDNETNLPYKRHQLVRIGSSVFADMTMVDFEWNTDLDDSLFDTTPPEGYELVESVRYARPIDNLVHMLRTWTDASGGGLPDDVKDRGLPMRFDDMVSPEGESLLVISQRRDANQNDAEQEVQKPLFTPAEMLRKQMRMTPIYSGTQEVARLIQSDRNFHYAGNGIRVDAEPVIPVMWYRTEDGSEYHVIYSDLSTGMTQQPPLPD